MVSLLDFSSLRNKNKAMMIAGTIMLVVGTVVSAYLGSVFVHDYASAAHPYPGYGIISPLETQIVFIFIAITGLGLIVWGLGGTQWAQPDLMQADDVASVTKTDDVASVTKTDDVASVTSSS